MNLFETIDAHHRPINTTYKLSDIHNWLDQVNRRDNPKTIRHLQNHQMAALLLYAGNINQCMGSNDYNNLAVLVEAAKQRLIESMSLNETGRDFASCFSSQAEF